MSAAPRADGPSGTRTPGTAGSWILVAFFLSGAAGLIQEVVWVRMLRLVMGNTTWSISTVLFVFMGGLALGSALLGRFAARRADPLRLFAALELSIGLYCLALPHAIESATPLFRWIHEQTGGRPALFVPARFAFCCLLLLAPATAMGGTLPVLTRHLARVHARAGSAIARLYAVNSLGAVAGAAASAFLLIRLLGLRNTIAFGSALSFAAATLALLLHRAAGPAPAAASAAVSDGAAAPLPGPRLGPAGVRVLLVGYALSGLAALVYEVAWSRVLSLLIGSSVYAFGLMLTAFILGLSLGSLAAARFVDRLRDPLRALALLQMGIGLSALVVVPLLGELPLHVTGLISRLRDSFWLLQLAELGLVLAVMLVPTLLMGAAFPVASRIHLASSSAASHTVGSVYGSNTLGSILGSVACGFVLIPWLGIQGAILSAVGLNVALGCLFLLQSPGAARGPRLAGAALAVLVAAGGMAAIPRWDDALMSLGPFFQARWLAPEVATDVAALEALAAEPEVLFHREGVTTTVTVKEYPGGVRALFVNGKSDAISEGDRPTQVLLAHLPLLLHAHPRDVLQIGLASGITLGAASLHPLERLECVEISPAVVEATRYFDAWNQHVLDDPRVRVIESDGRNHLAMDRTLHDVIVSQPSNPWIAGVADLFTLEFFRLCRERLAPGGVVCIWLETTNIGAEPYRSVVATFREVFPGTTLWNAKFSPDYLLIGARDGLDVDLDRLRAAMARPALAADLAGVGVHSAEELLGHLVTGDAGAARLAAGARLHTDDNALLEFAAPLSVSSNREREGLVERIESEREPDFSFLHAGDADDLDRAVAAASRLVRARGHVMRAGLLFPRGLEQPALEELRLAARLEPDDVELARQVDALAGQARDFAAAGRIGRAAGLWRSLVEIHPDRAAYRLELARLLERQGKLEEAALERERAAGSGVRD